MTESCDLVATSFFFLEKNRNFTVLLRRTKNCPFAAKGYENHWAVIRLDCFIVKSHNAHTTKGLRQ